MPFRTVAAAAVALAIFIAPASASDAERHLTTSEIDSFLHQARAGKPSASGGGNDTCRWANDRECDHPGIGTGACSDGTDWSDCRFLINGEDDSCTWANDNECDEPGLGTGACTQGTDRTDCAGVVHLRFRNDDCATAFNDICEEPGPTRVRGANRCDVRTDRADCVGRKRPMTINDHFRGYDDRVIFATDVYPWTAVGSIEFEDGSECTATLIAPDVLITASHCVHDSDGGLTVRGVFNGGFDRPEGATSANVIGYLVAPRFDHDLFGSTDKLDGTDWSLLRLDQAIGDELGVVGVQRLTTADHLDILQAGYSWDTGSRLSGNESCTIVSLHSDGTLVHTCDTTQGDSGSPLMVRSGDAYSVIGIDSNYRTGDGPPINIAVRAMGFASFVDDFIAGRIGETLTVIPQKPKSNSGVPDGPLP